jgi:tRNA-dihydrouridine synthase
MSERLGIVLDHLRDTLNFYDDVHGLRIFRKHLGWYIEAAMRPLDAAQRRAAKSRLCQMISARDVESALIALWAREVMDLAA